MAHHRIVARVHRPDFTPVAEVMHGHDCRAAELGEVGRRTDDRDGLSIEQLVDRTTHACVLACHGFLEGSRTV